MAPIHLVRVPAEEEAEMAVMKQDDDDDDDEEKVVVVVGKGRKGRNRNAAHEAPSEPEAAATRRRSSRGAAHTADSTPIAGSAEAATVSEGKGELAETVALGASVPSGVFDGQWMSKLLRLSLAGLTSLTGA